MELGFALYDRLPKTTQNGFNIALMETTGAWSMSQAPWLTDIAKNELHSLETKLWKYTIPPVVALNTLGFVSYILL